MGDVLMTSPAIRALKETVKGRKITLLTSSAGSGIARFIPCIDNVITFDPPWQGDNEAPGESMTNTLVRQLREEKFDAAVIFNVYSQNPLPAAMICYMAGIPRVAAYCRENPYRLVSDWIPDREPLYEIKHEVTRQIDLVKALGAKVKSDRLFVDVPALEIQAVQARLASLGIDPARPWLVIHPGVSEARRQYPPELFAEVAHALAEEMSCQVVLTGSASERELALQIADEAGDNVVPLAGAFSLAELIALIKLSPLVIANNTGPAHIAAAVGTPVVVLYALTNPQHAPWKVKHTVLPFDVPAGMRSRNTIIAYAYDKAFNNPPSMVHPQQVIEAARKMLLQHEVHLRTQIVKL
jgi:lipopolysaccharide heptosyltransferase II